MTKPEIAAVTTFPAPQFVPPPDSTWARPNNTDETTMKIHSSQWTPRQPLTVNVGYPVLRFARSGESRDRPVIKKNFVLRGPCPVMSLLHKILIGTTRPKGVIIR